MISVSLVAGEGVRLTDAGTSPVTSVHIPFGGAVVQTRNTGGPAAEQVQFVRVILLDGSMEWDLYPAKLSSPSGLTAAQLRDQIVTWLASGPSVGTVSIAPQTFDLTNEDVANTTGTVAAGAVSVIFKNTHATVSAEITTSPDVVTLNPGDELAIHVQYPAQIGAIAWDCTGSALNIKTLA